MLSRLNPASVDKTQSVLLRHLRGTDLDSALHAARQLQWLDRKTPEMTTAIEV